MKKIFNVLSITFLVVVFSALFIQQVYFVVADDGSESVPFDYTCQRPDDIPDTLRDGTKVYWDCDWQASYLNKRTYIIWDKDGNGAVAVGRKLAR